MLRLPHASCGLLAVSFAAATLAADIAGPAANATPTLAPASPAPHADTPVAAAMLAAAVAKYTPPASTAPRPTETPRNTIVRLPPYVMSAYIVRERRVPRFSEREMLTPKGKIALAYKKHPGLHFNPLFFLISNDGAALMMEEEEERLERIAEMNDLVGLYRIGGETEAHRQAQGELEQLQMRPSDWVSTGGSYVTPK
ncbi:MAG TPA: hypothetical protein VHD62_19125 [Opitutaceae bacterium]|nr:hypothetical protein [Opitutaceae bacterium]